MKSGRRLGPAPKARGQEGQHRRRHLGPHPGQAHQDLGLGEGGEEGLDSGFHLPQEPLHAGQLPLGGMTSKVLFPQHPSTSRTKPKP